jgi:hypothetical protein
MKTLLSSPYFTFLLFPLGSVLLGVGIKFVSRNDKFASFKKEDVAVGLDLWLTALLLFIVTSSERATRLKRVEEEFSRAAVGHLPTLPKLQAQAQAISDDFMTSGWLMLLMFIGLWGVSTIVRKWGWRAENDMTEVVGIAFPLVSGVLALIGVMAVAR